MCLPRGSRELFYPISVEWTPSFSASGPWGRRCVTIGLVPKVTFLPAGETFEFESGKLPYKGHGLPESLLDVAMNFGFHLEHACGGNCACTTCHVVVKQGDQNLSEMEDDELDRVEQAADFQMNSRLGCQAVVQGDVTVYIPEWNRNYISEGGGSILGDAIPGARPKTTDQTTPPAP